MIVAPSFWLHSVTVPDAMREPPSDPADVARAWSQPAARASASRASSACSTTGRAAGWPIGCVRPRVALLSARDGRSGIHGDTALNRNAAGQGVADHTILLGLFNHALDARGV